LNLCKTSLRKSWFTLSKSLAMSNFITILDSPLLKLEWIASWTRIKLSHVFLTAKKTSLIEGDRWIKKGFQSINNYLRHDFIRNITKRNGSESVKGGNPFFFPDECQEWGVCRTSHSIWIFDISKNYDEIKFDYRPTSFIEMQVKTFGT
jgi:hypothetical protein